jgi:hypothetical protein
MGVIKKVFKGKGGKEMIWAIITLIIAIVVYVSILCLADNEDNRGLIIIGGWAKFIIISVIVFLIDSKYPTPTPTPTALDVYRGKTTLEITYRDSVAIDSTVVYKVR